MIATFGILNHAWDRCSDAAQIIGEVVIVETFAL